MLGENTALSATRVGAQRPAPAELRKRYVLEARLEQGRLGAVYKAADKLRGQGGRPHVAVLILPAEISRNTERLAAFQSEFGAVSALSHPNIVELYDIDADGETHFLVLEWIDGESLRTVIDGLAPESVCESDALSVVRAVGSALVYAHAKGVVHGDIRPENVIVTEHGEVLLLFASACLAKSAPFSVGPRDDVRGLAALAYELMTGAPPPPEGFYGRGSGTEPTPIEGLSRKRWKALKSALAPRDGRIASVRQLLAALEIEDTRASPTAGRKPRRGNGRSVRGQAGRGAGRRFVLGAVWLLAAIAIVAAAVWLLRSPPQASERASLSSRVTSDIDRAAEGMRSGVAAAKERVESVSGALAAFLASRSADSSVPGEEAPANVNDDERSAEIGDAAAREAPAALLVPAGDDPAATAAESRDDEQAGDSEASASEDVSGAAIEPISGANDGTTVVPDVAAPSSPSAVDRASESSARAESVAADRGGSAGVAAAAVMFTRPEYTVSESDGVAAIEVRRADTRGSLSFVWWTRDGTARAGEDYADLGRVVEQFGAGEAVRTLYVPIISDSVPEERLEHFEVHVGVLTAQGNQSGALESARVVIVDDD
jgi:hypothetical protein